MRYIKVALLVIILICRWPDLAIAGVRCHLKEDGQNQVLIADLPDSFWQPSGALRKVRDGLALTLDRKIELMDNSGKIIAERSGRCRLVYDIWAEVFSIVDSAYTPFGEFKYPNAKGSEALEKCVGIPTPSSTNYSVIHVVTLVNPVDAHQEERTRTWLATKGIGGSGSGVIGRALGAVINLKTESVVDYDCTP